jgi:ABC-type polysaccharide/polyol phosphate transport system ATPase subunit
MSAGGEPVLVARGLWKRFARDVRQARSQGLRDIGRELIARPPRGDLRPGEFWVLEDVDLELRPGDAVAVLGANGAGKTTLLRLLTGLLKPDRGEVRVRGRLEALLELGTGIEPLLTGRENLLVVAALHRITGAAARRLLDEVVAFAELEEVIDAPVQTYSAGMRARLAYSLSAHLRPDVLLVDEVLAVGDLAFQRRCVNHMRSYIAEGGAVVLVSHSVFHVQTLCERGVLLVGGRVAYSGTAVEAVEQLFRHRFPADGAAPSAPATDPIAIEDVTIEAVDEGELQPERPATIRLRYRTDRPLAVRWAFSIWTSDQWVCVTGDVDPRKRELAPGGGELSCTVPRLPLLPGRYSIRAALLEAQSRGVLAYSGWDDIPTFFHVGGTGDATLHVRMSMQQLTSVDVEWP